MKATVACAPCCRGGGFCTGTVAGSAADQTAHTSLPPPAAAPTRIMKHNNGMLLMKVVLRGCWRYRGAASSRSGNIVPCARKLGRPDPANAHPACAAIYTKRSGNLGRLKVVRSTGAPLPVTCRVQLLGLKPHGSHSLLVLSTSERSGGAWQLQRGAPPVASDRHAAQTFKLVEAATICDRNRFIRPCEWPAHTLHPILQVCVRRQRRQPVPIGRRRCVAQASLEAAGREHVAG